MAVWQDREIRFDSPIEQLKIMNGEVIIDKLHNVEDTKGNNGVPGRMVATNMRLVWSSLSNRRTNLSIGYGVILSVNKRPTLSKLQGSTEALLVMTKFQDSRFEFVFTNLVKDTPRLFTTVQSIFRAYDTTRIYRDLKLRAAIIADKQLILLQDEQIYSQITGVWNLSNDQGNLGTFVVTNVRLVWFANLAENFNVSIPYIQIKTLKMSANSKFGSALVVETSANSGGYTLGFRIHPPEKLVEVYNELLSLWEIFSKKPIFGIKFSHEFVPASIEDLTESRVVDDIAIIDHEEEKPDIFATYYAADSNGADQEPVYSAELGLAIESLKEGHTLEQLWKVL